MDTISSVIVSLREAAYRPVSDVGGKAANLASLLRAGFPVPKGVVITAAAFATFVDAHGFGPGTPPETVRAADLPSKVAAQLHQALGLLGGPVAVRSSGLAEDLAGASYAGQYETVLGVEHPTDAEDALRHCWASAFEEHLVRYHQAHGNLGVPAMAVLIQRMVPAEMAGVAFSANPVTGDRHEIVINAVRGLADRLVAGEVDAEQWLVRRSRAERVDGGSETLMVAQALRVADLARRVEKHFLSPQDIEWAITGNEIHLLQARPITTLPDQTIEVPVQVPPGYWEREASHAPRPLTPFTGSFICDVETDGIRRALAEFGLLLETIELREIGGWVYVRYVPLGGKDGPTPPAWLMPLLIRLVPRLSSRIRFGVEAIRFDKAGKLVDRWYQEWQPELAARLGALRSIELADLSDEELSTHLGATMELLREATRVHFLLHAAICFPLAELAFTSKELLGWEEARTWELLSGLSKMSTEPARRLSGLTKMIGARPALRQIIEQGGSEALGRLTRAAPDFASLFTAYMTEFGSRALSYDCAEGSLAESPELVVGLIADQLAREFDPDGEETHLTRARRKAVAEARETLAARNPSDQNRWETALARGELAYPIREDNSFYTIGGPLALIRYTAFEFGRRLAERSQLALHEDVFYLTLEEVAEALGDDRSRVELVARRRAERARVEAHPGPESYGKHPGPPPSLAALPEEARFANQALLWYAEQIIEPKQSAQRQAGGEIRGIPASQGRYRGPVRVIMSEAEFGKLEAGDILVCPMTSPVWSVLFPSIGALVTDSGGILSHPAIIAREYRVPAVVATGNATRLLRDGQIVTVDGTMGSVEAT